MAGARDFIGKPFSIDEFILRFNKMMRDHGFFPKIEAKKNEMLLHLEKSLKILALYLFFYTYFFYP